MKVFLDTNVWLSATIFAGLCEDIVLQCAERGSLVSSPLIRDEAHEVLKRKFASQPNACTLFDAAWSSATLIDDLPEPAQDNDMRLILAAVATSVDVFVTGDKRVLSWDKSAPEGMSIGAMRIVSPREAWTMLFAGHAAH